MKKREFYLSQLRPTYDMPYIKYLVGIRGTGKTTIFNDIISELKNNNIDESHIIYINFEFIENMKLRDVTKLEKYLKSKVIDNNLHYVFLDEIQYVMGYEKLLSKFSIHLANLNIFASCSNSRGLKENFGTLNPMQYAHFYITPLGYKEVCEILNANPHDKNVLLNYLKYGGFPERIKFRKSSEVKKYLYSALDSIFLRDVVIRLGTNNVEQMIIILKYLVKHIGEEFTEEMLKEEVLSNEKEFSENDFIMAFDALEKSLLIHSIHGYNVYHNIPLQGKFRFYLNDLSLTFLFGFDPKNNMNQFLKNLVWLELKRRGYDVYQGCNTDSSFDFVAKRNSKILYIQVVEYLEDGNSINKEIEKFGKIEHLNQKILLSLDRENYSRKGVLHRNLIDFLLEDINDIEDLGRPYGWVSIE